MSNRYREEEKEELQKEKLEEMEEVILDENCEVDLEKANEEKANEEELVKEVTKYKEQYLRVLAEAENYKKRTSEERIRERKYFNQSLIEKLVNALDIFDKTVNIKTDDEKLKKFLIGFSMINNNLKQILADEGVKPIESLGKKFNPSIHHAIETEYQEDKEEDIILEEIQRGYLFKDRVLKAALVKVNKKPKNNQEEN